MEDWESSGGKSGIFRLYADMTGEASNGYFGFFSRQFLNGPDSDAALAADEAPE
jgi:hypothetical protein